MKRKKPPVGYEDAPETPERYHSYPSYTKIPRDRMDYTISCIEKQLPTRLIVQGLITRYGISDPAARTTIKRAFEYLADLGRAERPWRREQIVAGLRKIYFDASEAADINGLMDRLAAAGADWVTVSKIIQKFDPERSRSNALRALDQLAKVFGAYEAETVNVNVTEELSPAERQNRILELLTRAKESRSIEHDEGAQARVLDKLGEPPSEN